MTEQTLPRTEANDPLLLTAREISELVAPAPWRRFAVMGDSVAEGLGDASPGYTTAPWADRVAGALRVAHPELEYLNTGRATATIAQVREGQLQRVLDFAPDLVHINCGGNDLFAPEQDLDAVEDALDRLFADVRASGARLSTFTLADAYPDRLREFRSRFAAFAGIVRRVSARHDAIMAELWEHPARLRQDWLSADRIHLTMAGHAVVATEMIRVLGRSAAE